VPGTTTSSRDVVLSRYERHVNTSLARVSRLLDAPVEARSAGSQVYGEDGEAYLDCGGFGVFLLGHCHPVVVDAVRRQLEHHPLATRLFLNPKLAEAAAALSGVAPAGLDYVFLTNSGAEAVEVGLKLARLAGKTRVVAMDGGFHGKTMGALSVTGRPQYRDPFAPLLPGVEFVPFGDAAALDAALVVDGASTAVILEPVQAEGGVNLPPPGYLRHVRDACTRAGSGRGGAPTWRASPPTCCWWARSSAAASCPSGVWSPRPRSSHRSTRTRSYTPPPSPAARWPRPR
jgi:putrescine aminotransferase